MTDMIHSTYLVKVAVFTRLQVQESTFEQEPGSGAKAIVEGKLVTVGTLEWLRRCITCAFLF